MDFDQIREGQRLKLVINDALPTTAPERVAYSFRPGTDPETDTWIDIFGSIVAMRGWDAFLTYEQVGTGYFG